jgi:hypothetical protein
MRNSLVQTAKTKLPEEAFRRHVLVDNINRIIFIQVMTNLKGDLLMKEYKDITENGQWYNYIHPMLREQIGKVKADGYRVQAVMIDGYETEGYRFLQVVELRENKIIKPAL